MAQDNGPGAASTSERDRVIAEYARLNKRPTSAWGRTIDLCRRQHIRFHMLMGTMALDTWEAVYVCLLLGALLLLTLYGAYKQVHKLGVLLVAYLQKQPWR